jgi:hypothetical protein
MARLMPVNSPAKNELISLIYIENYLDTEGKYLDIYYTEITPLLAAIGIFDMALTQEQKNGSLFQSKQSIFFAAYAT